MSCNEFSLPKGGVCGRRLDEHGQCDRAGDHREAQPVCVCGAVQFNGCFCGLSLKQFLASPGEREY